LGVREKVALALRLRRQGTSYREVAQAVGCSPNTVSYLLGFGRLDPLDLAEFLAGRIGVNEAERLVRRAAGADRVSGGPGTADVVRLRLLLARALELLEVGRVPSLVPVGMLKPHPKNSEYFSDPTPEKYEEIKRSIEAGGMRDPLRVTPDYTVITGHVRLKIAQELGLTHVPVEIWDVDPETAEYLMIADNEERRYCQDPVRKAKRAEFLRRYWGVREGAGRPKKLVQNALINSGSDASISRKTLADLAEGIGESVDTVKRLLKLNDLIPPLQGLVSRGKLAQTAAYSLAFLPPEEQRRLLDVLGESGVCGLSVQEAQELRRQLDAERKRVADVEARARDLERQLAQAQEGSREAELLRAELARLREENERLKARGPEVVEKVVERVVVRPDPVQEAEVARLREEVERLQVRLAEAEAKRSSGDAEDLERQLAEKREELLTLQAQINQAERWLQSRRATQGLLVMLRKLFLPLERAREEVGERLRTSEFGALHHLEVQEWIALLEWYLRRLRDLLNVRTAEVIDVTAYEEGGRNAGRGLVRRG